MKGTALSTATRTMAVADSMEGMPVSLAAPYGRPSWTAPSASFSIANRAVKGVRGRESRDYEVCPAAWR